MPRFRSLTRPLRCAALLLLPLFACPGQAKPQDTQYADMPLRELMSLEVFTAASLLPTEYSKAPGTVFSFGREDFTRLGIRRLDDLLQFVPGFQINQYRKRHRSIWGRGLLDRYNDKFVLMVDGVQQRHLYYGHFALGDNFPLEKVEKVEIIQGPASSLYGANAFAGIIAITTRSFSDKPAVEATLEAGDNSRGKASALYNSPQVQVFASHLDQDAAFSNDRRSFIGGEVLQPLDERYSNLFVKVRPFDGLTLSLDYQRNDTPFLFIPSTQDAFVEERPLTLSALYESGDLDRGRIEIKGHYTRDRAREYEVEQITRRDAYDENQNATMFGATITGFKRLFQHHTLALGASWQHEQADDFDYLRHFRYDTGFIDPPFSGSLLSDPQIENDDFALFAQDVWDLRPDLTLTLGARHDRYEAFGGHTNYRAALVYNPSDRQVWKLLYGTADRTPSYREYLKVLERTRFAAPVPDPEHIESLELGYLYQWDRANLSLTLFHNEIEGYIHEHPTPDGSDEYFTNSETPWRMHGAEALVKFRLDRRLHLRLSAAYLQAEEEGAGDLPYLAKWSGSANLNYNYVGNHSAGLTLIYNSDRSDTNDSPEDDPGSLLLVNLYGFGRLSDSLSYSTGIDNLFDEKVYDPAADFGGQYNTERTRREIWARLEWRPDF
jgi:outer membrane receptor for ferrienterochelin and colicins